ncbi:hypothetical protein [Corynebacterium propinquum]
MNRRDWENDDFFLDQLSQGIDPSQGQDPLAAALLGLRTEIESEIPAAPELADDWLAESTRDGSNQADDIADQGSANHNVVALRSAEGRSRHRISRADARRSRRASRANRHGSGGGVGAGPGAGAGRRFGWGSALVGAAAATALFAVGSVSVYHATPNSPLWGVHQSLFDDEEAARVELASTLEQLEDSAHRGDEDATRQLIAEARTLLDNLRERKEAKQNKGAAEGAPGKDGSANTEAKTTKPKATVTRVRPQPEGESEPQTVTETKEVTVTKTVEPSRQNPQPAPGGNQEPRPRQSAGEQAPLAPQPQPQSPGQPQPESQQQSQQQGQGPHSQGPHGQEQAGQELRPGNDNTAPAGPES